jgi:sodium-dependent phosphate cotransporter
LIAFNIFLFLLAIDFIGYSFRLLNKDIADSIINLTANPFISLFIGLLITAIIQSSSTSTSMIVAIVASGSIEFSDAIPMIMGANIGTTLTSTLVSLSFITNRDEFRKAIGAGVVHDFFNILVVAILFPLEYNYGVLTNLSSAASNFILGADYVAQNTEFRYFLFTKPIVLFIGDLVPYPVVLAISSFVMLAIAVKFLSKTLYKTITGGSREFLQKYFFGSPYRSFFWGIVFTAGVQSSSVTTSVIVPFVATRKISLKQSFTFILGANIGTTITALIAALFKSEAAVSIALVHLFFNLIGVLIFLPFPIIRNIPVRMAESFGKLAMKFRIAGFVYIIVTFFLIPFILISFNKEDGNAKQERIKIEEGMGKSSAEPLDSLN